jgi:signal transduction histidine kinase
VVNRALVACGIAATIAAALVGLWASRRLLRPLRQLADTAVRVADGHLDTRVPTAQDLELAMIGESVNRMGDSLQGRIEHERRFFGDVSHELRTPLTTLVTAVGVLRRHRDALPTRAGQAFDLVDTEVTHLRRLPDHLLALARAEAGLHQRGPDSAWPSSPRRCPRTAGTYGAPTGRVAVPG